MSDFLTIGEPMALFASQDEDQSLTQSVNFKKYLAGAEVNVAVGVSRLGYSTEYVTQLGADPLGEFIKEQLAVNYIGTSYISQTSKYWTAFQMKQRFTKGDPGVAYFRKNSAASHIDDVAMDQIDLTDVKLVHLTGIFPAISDQAELAFSRLLQLIHRHPEIRTTFDPNLRPQLWRSQAEMVEKINQFAMQADIIMPGLSEGEILVGSREPETIADFYLENGINTDTVIIKMGETGAFIKTKDGNHMMIPGYSVDHVVDTVGAGDGFAVGVITGLLDGMPLENAVRRGNAIGSLAVQSPGDNDGYPTREKLNAYQL